MTLEEMTDAERFLYRIAGEHGTEWGEDPAFDKLWSFAFGLIKGVNHDSKRIH